RRLTVTVARRRRIGGHGLAGVASHLACVDVGEGDGELQGLACWASQGVCLANPSDHLPQVSWTSKQSARVYFTQPFRRLTVAILCVGCVRFHGFAPVFCRLARIDLLERLAEHGQAVGHECQRDRRKLCPALNQSVPSPENR